MLKYIHKFNVHTKMKLQKPSFINKKYVAIGFIILLAAFSVLTYVSYHYQIGPFKRDAQITEEELERQNKSDVTNPQTKGIAEPNNDVDSSKNTSEIPVSDSTSVEITSLQQGNGQITYSAKFTGQSSDGTCSATFTNELARPVIRTTPAKDSICGPVSIPETEFTTLGNWVLTVRYYKDNTQAVATKSIEVK